MQDKTIDNALLALWKQNGPEIEHVEQIMAIRGIPKPRYRHVDPLVRGKCRRIALDVLANGPCTNAEAAEAFLRVLPGISRRSAVRRAHGAFLRLEEAGRVVSEKNASGRRVWRLDCD